MAYLSSSDENSATDFALFSTIPRAQINELETIEPGWLDTQLELGAGFIDSRMAKRCKVPFVGVAPLTVRGWLAKLVTPLAYRRLGVGALDESYVDAKDERNAALSELKEFANSTLSLLDVPTTDQISSISKGFPRVSTQHSPFVWRDDQRESGAQEDAERWRL